MVQGRSTKIVSMVKWIRTSSSTIKNSLSDDKFPDNTILQVIVA